MRNNSSRHPTRRILIHPLLSSSLLVTESTTKIPQELRVSVFEFLLFKRSFNIFDISIEFNMQRSSPKGSMMTIENTNGMIPVNIQHNGFEKFGANSPLLRVGTTITTSTNITTS